MRNERFDSGQQRAMKEEVIGPVTKTSVGKLYGDIQRKRFISLEEQRREYLALFDLAETKRPKA